MEDEGFVPAGLDMGDAVGEFEQEKDSKRLFLFLFNLVQTMGI